MFLYRLASYLAKYKDMLILCVFALVLTASVAPSTSHFTCPAEESLDADVIILGGGIAGINTGKTLADEGVRKIIVIEARRELGGRMRRMKFGGYNIELGANEVEGLTSSLGNDQKNPLWDVVVKKCGLKGKFMREYKIKHLTYEDGKIINDTKEFNHALHSMSLAVKDSLRLQKLNTNKDLTVRAQLRKFGWNPTTPLERMLDWMLTDFGDAQSPDSTSTFRALPLPLNGFGTDCYFIQDERGYSHVVDCLAADFISPSGPHVLHLNTLVTDIYWSDKCVCVEVTMHQGRKRLCAKRAVYTFSVGVLQSKEGQAMFHPPLPEWKSTPISKLQFTYYMKLFLKFDRTFWNNNYSAIYRVDKLRGRYPFIQLLGGNLKILPSDSNMLLFFLTDDYAYKVGTQSEEKTKQEVMAIMREMFGPNIPDPTDILISKWITDPLYRGMFTNIGPSVSKEIVENAQRKMGNLYFSGEGMCRKYFGTVLGGYESGITTAKQILSDMEYDE